MSALREYGRRLWAIHCNVARRISAEGFAAMWGVIGIAGFVLGASAPEDWKAAVLRAITSGAFLMCWLNATGKIER